MVKVIKIIMWPNKYIINDNYTILRTKSSNQHILKRKNENLCSSTL